MTKKTGCIYVHEAAYQKACGPISAYKVGKAKFIKNRERSYRTIFPGSKTLVSIPVPLDKMNEFEILCHNYFKKHKIMNEVYYKNKYTEKMIKELIEISKENNIELIQERLNQFLLGGFKSKMQ